MLTGEASDYYYRKISGVCATFDAMVYAVRTHFETEERRQRVTTEWEDTNLVQIRDKNLDKSLMECFELMKNQLIPRSMTSKFFVRNFRRTLLLGTRSIAQCAWFQNAT
jgi:hypothetical protein